MPTGAWKLMSQMRTMLTLVVESAAMLNGSWAVQMTWPSMAGSP
jgi:hypothetical protein